MQLLLHVMYHIVKNGLARQREYDRIMRSNMNEQQREAALQQRREQQRSISSTERLARR